MMIDATGRNVPPRHSPISRHDMAKLRTQDATPAGGVPQDGGAPGGAQKLPEFGTAKPAEPGGPLPRFLNQLERATVGTTRYKVVARDPVTAQRIKYVLVKAGDDAEEDAKAFYCKETKQPAGQMLAVTRLPD